MDHKADVGLINPHAEGHGGDHHLQVITLESFLHLCAPFVIQPRVVSGDTQATALQTGSGVFHFGAAVAVNNATFSALVLDKAPQLIERFELLYQGVADIRAVKAANLNQWLIQIE